MSTQIRVWDPPVRVFHWLLAGSFMVAYFVAESDNLRYQPGERTAHEKNQETQTEQRGSRPAPGDSSLWKS